jgi:carbonic anhydrase
MKLSYVGLVSSLIIPLLFSNSVTANQHHKIAHNDTQWSYQGATGPNHWAQLSQEYNTCHQGKNQSPVNINKAIDARLPAINFDYTMLVPENIINTGHSIQVNIRSGGSIKLNDKEFILKQFHFHSPSENMIDNKRYPLEAHFVHVSKDNELAVVALLYQPGVDNLALMPLLKQLPMKPGETTRLSAEDTQLFERKKSVKNYFYFNGSLTTPPCTEGVHWIVMQSRPGLSKRQLTHFQNALKYPNNRPIQPLNARIVTK